MSNLVSLQKIKSMRSVIYNLASQYGVSNIRVFGSVARNTNTQSSDIDLLVTLSEDFTLLDLGGFLSDLEEVFGCKVDVVPDDSINPDMREHILSEAVAV